MQEEIEAKFLDIDHDQMRAKLEALGAELIHPMRRSIFDYPDGKLHASGMRLRIRDEGDKITMTYKSEGRRQYANEIETVVESYDRACAILEAVGLKIVSVQESKRETWRYNDTEIELDEWPWAPQYMEIEGKDEKTIKTVAVQLGLDWSSAAFGTTDSAYRKAYPGIKEGETIGAMSVIRFDTELPQWLRQRQ